jgi:hypothetical protein
MSGYNAKYAKFTKYSHSYNFFYAMSGYNAKFAKFAKYAKTD